MELKPIEIIRHFDDLEVSIVAQLCGKVAWVEFFIYKIVSIPKQLPRDYEDAGNSWGITLEPDELKQKGIPLIIGEIKWDGCSNWDFSPPPDPCKFHGCDREDLFNIGQVLLKCWDIAKELMPEQDLQP